VRGKIAFRLLRRAAANRFSLVFLSLVLLSVTFFTEPGLSKNAGAHQVRQMEFGVSGGNSDDFDPQFCCAGTLGSLVTDGTSLFILSNNHVLARSDQATPGEPISQPGLIDNNCNTATVVANLTTFVPLTSNTVDAALAKLIPGEMTSDGSILGVGQISSIPVSASIGLAVEKSGRTTGVTSSSVEAVNTDVKVVYTKRCAEGKKFAAFYNNQVMVRGKKFSAAGDSGSLIVTNNECHQPVALLYAGNSNSTVGNPAQDVLSALGVSFVGNSADCSGAAQAIAGAQFSQLVRFDDALTAKNERRNYLMSLPGVLAVGVAASDTDPTRAAIIVYVDQTLGANTRIPSELDSVPVQVRLTDPFVAR